MQGVFHLIRWKILLTWRLYTRNVLVSVETLLFFVFFIVWMALWCGVIFRVTQWLLSIRETPVGLVFSDLFSFIFIIWMLMALAGYRLNESYDLSRLRTHPIPLRTVFLATILGPLFDLSVLLPLGGMLAALAAVVPSPSQLPVAALMVLIMVFFTVSSGVALVNVLLVFLPKLSMIRVAVGVLLLTLLWSILLNLGYVQYPYAFFFMLLRPVGLELFKNYPTGQIGIALAEFLERDYRMMVMPLLGFTAWLAGILALNYITVKHLWTSDIPSKSASGYVGAQDLSPRLVGMLERVAARIAGPQAAAFFAKDLFEFAFRNPYFIIYKTLPGTIAPIIILLAMKWNLENIVQYSPIENADIIAKNVTLALVLFIVIAQGNLFAGNQFGLEDTAIKNLFVLPTPRRWILLGKNLFLGSLFLVDSIVLSLLLLLYFPGIDSFFMSLSLIITIFLLILGIGNFTSSIWPYWMPLDKPSFTLRSTVILSLVNSAATLVLLILSIPPITAIFYANLLGIRWISYLVMILSVAYGAGFHRLTLPSAVNLLESNEFLILRRVADREEL
jgi:hypothetical protein